MTSAIKEVRWTIVATLLFGIFISSSMTDRVSDWYNAWYDRIHPVVKMTGTLLSRTSSSVIINIKGEKLRPCRFVSMQAQVSKNGISIDAYKERVGLIEDGSTKPVGKHDLGDWLIWPLKNADIVSMIVTHDCEGRLITAVIAEIAI